MSHLSPMPTPPLRSAISSPQMQCTAARDGATVAACGGGRTPAARLEHANVGGRARCAGRAERLT